MATIEDDAVTAGAVGSTSLPLGARDETWDGNAAMTACKGAADYKKICFWQVPDGDPDLRSSYKLPFAVPGGSGHAVWAGVTAAAARLGQTQGVDEAAVKSKIEGYYAKARSKYSDDSIEVPWAGASLDAVEMGRIVVTELAKEERHDFRGDGKTCAICGKSATDEIHYGQEASARTAAAVAVDGKGWKANPLFFLDQPTRDGRILASASDDAKGPIWTDTPKTLMAQFQNPESGGHALAVVAGTMPGSDITLKGKRVLASGRFNSDENGSKAAEYVDNGSLTGISVDLAPQKWEIQIKPPEEGEGGIFFFSKDKPEPSDDDPIVISESIDDITLRFTEYEVAGATLVATPAFGEAQVSMTADADGRLRRIANPGLGRIYVHMRTTESGFPVPVRVTVGGAIMLEDVAPVGLPFQVATIRDFRELVESIDTAKLSGLMTHEEARAAFVACLRVR